MRILFSAHPAFGHLLPLLPIARATAGDGHTVAFIGAPDFEDLVTAEVPGAEYLPVGSAPSAMVQKMLEENRGDLSAPTTEFAGWIFGGLRVGFDHEASVPAARDWKPDVVVCDEYDGLGPLLAAAAGAPWISHAVGPGDSDVTTATTLAAEQYYRAWSLTPRGPQMVLDPCPAALKSPDWDAPAPVQPIRTEPFQSAHPSTPTTAPTDPTRESVLVTLGTVFSDAGLLGDIIDGLVEDDVDVVATRGLLLSEEAVAGDHPVRDGVRFVGMTPIAELLAHASVVVTAGGSGTVLAAAAAGVPMVLIPQGADQHLVAERAAAAGLGIVVQQPEAVPDAVRTVLQQPEFRDAARRVRGAIAEVPSPLQVARIVFAGLIPTGA
jgi:UDP:flavonoid glycosyltransferase YjiC (YdhE family)